MDAILVPQALADGDATPHAVQAVGAAGRQVSGQFGPTILTTMSRTGCAVARVELRVNRKACAMGHMRGKRTRLALIGVTVTAVVMSSVGGWRPAPAAPEDQAVSADVFSSSFEEGQPQPKWAGTVETDAQGNPKASGVNGADSVSIPGNVTDKGVAVQANSENSGSDEVKENVVDGNVNTKWLTFTNTGWLQFRLSEPTLVKRYALTSANDAAERDP